jgi:hypothetical protein
MQASGVGFASFDPEALPRRLYRMNDKELLRFGRAARIMCSPRANLGKPPLDCYMIQLQEARTEWRRRHPRESDRTYRELARSYERG